MSFLHITHVYSYITHVHSYITHVYSYITNVHLYITHVYSSRTDITQKKPREGAERVVEYWEGGVVHFCLQVNPRWGRNLTLQAAIYYFAYTAPQKDMSTCSGLPDTLSTGQPGPSAERLSNTGRRKAFTGICSPIIASLLTITYHLSDMIPHAGAGRMPGGWLNSKHWHCRRK